MVVCGDKQMVGLLLFDLRIYATPRGGDAALHTSRLLLDLHRIDLASRKQHATRDLTC